MKTIGLTGGIGMGKSSAGKILRERGIPVVDADDLSREVVAPGQPALREVQEAFGSDMLDADGSLRREKLARIVFADPGARQQLEAMLHPRIQRLWRAQLEAWRDSGSALAAVVVPLLFETRAEAEFDFVVCAACSAASQTDRLRARGWTPEQISRRIAAQMPVAEKMARAQYVIWTEGDLDVHVRQWERLLATTGGRLR